MFDKDKKYVFSLAKYKKSKGISEESYVLGFNQCEGQPIKLIIKEEEGKVTGLLSIYRNTYIVAEPEWCEEVGDEDVNSNL